MKTLKTCVSSSRRFPLLISFVSILLFSVLLVSASFSRKEKIRSHFQYNRKISITSPEGEMVFNIEADNKSIKITHGTVDKKISLPDFNHGEISDLKVNKWTDSGIAMSVEVKEKESTYSYYWVTIYVNDFVNNIDSSKGVYTEKFLSNEVKYDMSPPYNPHQDGDSFYIILSDFIREGKGEPSVAGHIYVNVCPIAPGIGKLIPLNSTSNEQ